MACASRCAPTPPTRALERAYAALLATRPTAINLKWALDEIVAAVRNQPREARVAAAYRRAAEIADEDVAINQAIGRHGLKLIEDIAARKNGEPVNVLTHCNAGWLATVDWRHRDRADLPGARQGHRASMSGSTRRGRATRALRSPPGSSASTACRTP